MNKRLILLFFTLSVYVACTSIHNPELEPEPDPPLQGELQPPVLHTPEDGADGVSTDIILQWQEVSGASVYDVQVATDLDFISLVTDTSTNSTSYELKGLEADTTYFWRINAESTSGWSETWNFSTLEKPDPVTADPPMLTAPANGADGVSPNVTLQWEEVTGVFSYEVQVATDQNFTDIVASSTISSTSFEPAGLENNTSYFWKVSAGSESSWSETWSFTTEQEAVEPPPVTSDIWVTAYLASWKHDAGRGGHLPTDAIDWDAFTHLIYFALAAKPDGTFAYNNMTSDRIKAIVSAAHEHGKPVIVSIGGWGNHDGFSQAIASGSRAAFVSNLVSLIKQRGFDGIDLDMEPIRDSDVSNYKAFVRDLHAALQNVTTPLGRKPLLTAATANKPGLFSELQQYFDQINLMTYDFSGAWPGWVSWHNSAVYSSRKFPNLDELLPSVDRELKVFLNAGISREKLGIGIDFYGYVWNGYVTAPGQTWSVTPQVQDNVPYHSIMDNYSDWGTYNWDGDAQGAYLSIHNSDPSKRKFISYDDEKSIRHKIDYTRQQGIGGVIIWELGGGYHNSQPSGSRDKLLQAVKNAVW